MTPADLARLLADRCDAPGRVVLGIDGPDAAGKTTLGDAVAELLGTRAVRASVDGFHHPRAVRSALPYEESFDTDRLVDALLIPFTTGQDRVLVQAYDHRADAPAEHVVAVPPDGVLVLDGVFLHRPERLRRLLDVSVFLDVPPEESLRRALLRDGDADPQRYRERYLPAQARYRPTVDADLVVDNTDPLRPVVRAERPPPRR